MNVVACPTHSLPSLHACLKLDLAAQCSTMCDDDIFSFGPAIQLNASGGYGRKWQITYDSLCTVKTLHVPASKEKTLTVHLHR